MEQEVRSATNRHIVYQIVGFDRVGFVGDVTNAIPQNSQYRITGLNFEGDGVRVQGSMSVQLSDEQQPAGIAQLLRAVPGVVAIRFNTPDVADCPLA